LIAANLVDSLMAYWPTFPGKPGCAGSSPGKPLGAAPVPIVPGIVVFGAPGWDWPGPGLMPVLEPVPMPVVPVPVVARRRRDADRSRIGGGGADRRNAAHAGRNAARTYGGAGVLRERGGGSCDQGHREQGRKTQTVSHEIFPVWNFSASTSLESRRSCPSLAMRSHRRLALAESGSQLQH
jgi:hypothetical protein